MKTLEHHEWKAALRKEADALGRVTRGPSGSEVLWYVCTKCRAKRYLDETTDPQLCLGAAP